MAEEHERCHLWPDCEIHAGFPRPRNFTPENIEEMKEMKANGITNAEIAQTFSTNPQTVSENLRGNRKWQRREG